MVERSHDERQPQRERHGYGYEQPPGEPCEAAVQKARRQEALQHRRVRQAVDALLPRGFGIGHERGPGRRHAVCASRHRPTGIGYAGWRGVGRAGRHVRRSQLAPDLVVDLRYAGLHPHYACGRPALHVQVEGGRHLYPEFFERATGDDVLPEDSVGAAGKTHHVALGARGEIPQGVGEDLVGREGGRHRPGGIGLADHVEQVARHHDHARALPRVECTGETSRGPTRRGGGLGLETQVCHDDDASSQADGDGTSSNARQRQFVGVRPQSVGTPTQDTDVDPRGCLAHVPPILPVPCAGIDLGSCPTPPCLEVPACISWRVGRCLRHGRHDVRV